MLPLGTLLKACPSISPIAGMVAFLIGPLTGPRAPGSTTFLFGDGEPRYASLAGRLGAGWQDGESFCGMSLSSAVNVRKSSSTFCWWGHPGGFRHAHTTAARQPALSWMWAKVRTYWTFRAPFDRSREKSKNGRDVLVTIGAGKSAVEGFYANRLRGSGVIPESQLELEVVVALRAD